MPCGRSILYSIPAPAAKEEAPRTARAPKSAGSAAAARAKSKRTPHCEVRVCLRQPAAGAANQIRTGDLVLTKELKFVDIARNKGMLLAMC